jgi:hypothetical protein
MHTCRDGILHCGIAEDGTAFDGKNYWQGKRFEKNAGEDSSIDIIHQKEQMFRVV